VGLVLPDRHELEGRLARLAGSLHRGWRRHLDGERRHLDQVRRRLPDLRRRLVEARLRLDDRSEALRRRLARRVDGGRQGLRLAASRLVLLSPGRLLARERPRLDTLTSRLWLGWRRRHQELGRHLDYCASHLTKLDPAAILARGYAVATKLPQGVILKDAAQAPEGVTGASAACQGEA
jgi:exodeoxyribonuclease VII large subunit